MDRIKEERPRKMRETIKQNLHHDQSFSKENTLLMSEKMSCIIIIYPSSRILQKMVINYK